MRNKWFSRITACLLSAAMLTAACGLPDSAAGGLFPALVAHAETEIIGRGSCGANAYWELGSDGELRIYGIGDVSDFSTTESAPWNAYTTRISTLVVEDGITGIGKMAFQNCLYILEVSFPSSLTSIGTRAFYGCNNIEHIHVPYGKTVEEFSGKGSLPSESEYYFELDEFGNCPVCSLIDKISLLGQMTSPSREEVDATWAEYNALSDEHKALITNLSTLERAEALAYYIPRNVKSKVNCGDITLTWNPVEGAAAYKVTDENGNVISDQITGVSCTLADNKVGLYKFIVYAQVNGEWGRPSSRVSAIVTATNVDYYRSTGMGAGVIMTGNNGNTSTWDNAATTAYTPLRFESDYTVIGENCSYIRLNSEITCTGSLKLFGNSPRDAMESMVWAIGGDLELDSGRDSSYTLDMNGTYYEPGKVIVGGDLFSTGVFRVPAYTDVYVGGNLYVENAVSIGGRLFVGGDVFIQNLYQNNWHSSSDRLFVGGNIIDETTNSPLDFTSMDADPKGFSKLDKSSEEWKGAFAELRKRTAGPKYEEWQVFDESDEPQHVTLKFNSSWKSVEYNGKLYDGYGYTNTELSIENYPNGVVIDDIIDVAEQGGVGGGFQSDVFCYIIDTGENPENVFKIRVQANNDLDGDGTNETFSWIPQKGIESFNSYIKPCILVKGRGTVVIEVPDDVLYKAKEQETLMHYNWYTMLGGSVGIRNGQEMYSYISLSGRDFQDFYKNGWIHSVNNCSGADRCMLREIDNSPYLFCDTHERAVNPREVSHDCGCGGAIEKSKVVSWITENQTTINKTLKSAFFDSKGEIILPNQNIFIVSNSKKQNIRLCWKDDEFCVGENCYFGWIYAPNMTFTANIGSTSAASYLVGGMITGNCSIDNSETIVHCRPETSAVSLFESNAIAPAPDVEVLGYSLCEMDEGIGVNIAAALSDEFASLPDVHMEYTLPSGAVSRVEINDARVEEIEGRYCYVFPCNVAAAEMADTITAKIKSGSYESEAITCSVQSCAKDILDNPEENAKIIPLVKAMLNYGAQAQSYFKHNTENLANSILPADEQTPAAVSAADLETFRYSISDNDSDLDFVGHRISLKERPVMKLYFKSKSGRVLETGDFTGDICGEISVGSDEKGQYLEISNIMPCDFDFGCTVSVGDVTVSNISVYSYLYRAVSAGYRSLSPLADALYAYHEAAEAYISGE